MAIKVDFTLSGIEGMTKSQVNDVMRDAMEDVGNHWHSEYLPKHFGNAASRRYGYTPRKGERGSDRRKWKGSYTYRKLKKYNHTRPLELTGQSKRDALNNRRVTAKATSKNASVVIALPQGFNRRHPASKVMMADEIREVIPSEITELEQFLVKRLDMRFDQAGHRVRSNVKLTQF